MRSARSSRFEASTTARGSAWGDLKVTGKSGCRGWKDGRVVRYESVADAMVKS
jgi:hypothetical protein